MNRRSTIRHEDNVFATREEVSTEWKEVLASLPFLGMVIALHAIMIMEFFGV